MKVSWFQLLVVAVVIGFSSIAFAQPGRGGFGFGGGLELLADENVQKELELVPEQQDKLRAVGEKMRDEMRDMFSGLRDLGEEERRERFTELREKMSGMREKMQEEMNDILLPQQRDRLAQLRFQSQLRRGGSTGGLTSSGVVEALDISEEQLEKMREKEEKVREELQQKIREATEEARKELMSVLSADQRKKYEELMGEPFEFQQRQGFQRGQGGNRGRGGDRGGRPERPQT